MAMLVITWDNPLDAGRAKEAEERAKEWRATVLKQPGLLEFNALTSRTSASTGMVVESFATASDAGTYLGSDQFAGIVSEMTSMGITNIKTDLWDQHRDVPEALRP